MSRLVGIAVGIGLSLVCDISCAGGPVRAGCAAWGSQAACARPSLHAAYGWKPGHVAYVPNPVLPRHADREPGFDMRHHRRRFVYGKERTNAGFFPGGYAAAQDDWDQSGLGGSCPAANWRTDQDVAIQDQAGRGDEARQGKFASRQAKRQPVGHTAGEGNGHVARSAPARLSPEQFDRQTGKISWPEALQGDTMETARRGLERLAAGQPASGDAAKNRSHEVRELTEQIKEQLKGQIREIPPADYVAARKFLNGLADELRPHDATIDLLADARR